MVIYLLVVVETTVVAIIVLASVLCQYALSVCTGNMLWQYALTNMLLWLLLWRLLFWLILLWQFLLWRWIIKCIYVLVYEYNYRLLIMYIITVVVIYVIYYHLWYVYFAILSKSVWTLANYINEGFKNWILDVIMLVLKQIISIHYW